jgi:hypothetical protein
MSNIEDLDFFRLPFWQFLQFFEMSVCTLDFMYRDLPFKAERDVINYIPKHLLDLELATMI